MKGRLNNYIKEKFGQATGQIVLEGSSGPYGPDTCHQGYVWREANDLDHVCVPVATRTQTRDDNSQDHNRKAPAPPPVPGSPGTFGSDACRSPYVWREAYPHDHVCVTQQTHDQALIDNSEAAKRRLGTLRITFSASWREGPKPFFMILTTYRFTGELRYGGVTEDAQHRMVQQWAVNGSYTSDPYDVISSSGPFPFEGYTTRSYLN